MIEAHVWDLWKCVSPIFIHSCCLKCLMIRIRERFSFKVGAAFQFDTKPTTRHSGDFPRVPNGLWPHNHLQCFLTDAALALSARCSAFSIASRLYHRGDARFTVRGGRGMGMVRITVSCQPSFGPAPFHHQECDRLNIGFSANYWLTVWNLDAAGERE